MRCDESSFLVFMALSVSGSFIGACGDGEITAQERSYDDEPASDPLDIDELTPGTNWWDWVEKPDARNTGPSNPGAIQSIGSCPTINEAYAQSLTNRTLENFQCTGRITVRANSVALRNFRINVESNWYGVFVEGSYSGLLMEDGEIYDGDGGGSCTATIEGMGWTGRRLNLHTCDDGLKPDIRNAGSPGGPVELTHSFIHDLSGGHGDGVQTWGLGANTVVFQYNTIQGGNTSAFIIHDAPSQAAGFKIHNNWLSHEVGDDGYTVYCQANVQVHNNLFGRNSGYGPVAQSGCDWQGNLYWDDFSVVPHP